MKVRQMNNDIQSVSAPEQPQHFFEATHCIIFILLSLSEKKNRLYLICIFYSLNFLNNAFLHIPCARMHDGQIVNEPAETETAVTRNGATRNDKTRYISIKSGIFQIRIKVFSNQNI